MTYWLTVPVVVLCAVENSNGGGGGMEGGSNGVMRNNVCKSAYPHHSLNILAPLAVIYNGSEKA